MTRPDYNKSNLNKSRQMEFLESFKEFCCGADAGTRKNQKEPETTLDNLMKNGPSVGQSSQTYHSLMKQKEREKVQPLIESIEERKEHFVGSFSQPAPPLDRKTKSIHNQEQLEALRESLESPSIKEESCFPVAAMDQENLRELSQQTPQFPQFAEKEESRSSMKIQENQDCSSRKKATGHKSHYLASDLRGGHHRLSSSQKLMSDQVIPSEKRQINKIDSNLYISIDLKMDQSIRKSSKKNLSFFQSKPEELSNKSSMTLPKELIRFPSGSEPANQKNKTISKENQLKASHRRKVLSFDMQASQDASSPQHREIMRISKDLKTQTRNARNRSNVIQLLKGGSLSFPYKPGSQFGYENLKIYLQKC